MGRMTIWSAAKTGDSGTLERAVCARLLAGGGLDDIDPVTGKTAVETAAERGYLNCVELLGDFGVSTDGALALIERGVLAEIGRSRRRL